MKQYKYRPTSRKPLMDNLHPRIEWFEDKFGNSDNYSFNHTRQTKPIIYQSIGNGEQSQGDREGEDKTAETLSGLEMEASNE